MRKKFKPTDTTDTQEAVPSNDLLCDAAARLEALAARWEETPEWHEPPFLDGRIHITTGDLRAISIIVRGRQCSHSAHRELSPPTMPESTTESYGG